MSKGLLGTILILTGVLIAVFGFYTSFEVYVIDRLSKSSESIGHFLIKAIQNDTLIEVPNASNTIITLETPEGKTYATQGINLPIDKGMYYHFRKNADGYNFVLYIKSINIFEYLEYLLGNPAAMGISIAGGILILMGIYTVLSSGAPDVPVPKEQESKPEPEKVQGYDDELIKHLKALRLTLATSKIIPEESLEKAKSIIDSILSISKGGKA